MRIKLAHFFSVLFHPLLMPTYGCALLFFGIKGTVYDYMTPFENKWRLLIIILMFSFLLPGLNIFLLYRLKRIPSISLSEQRHRTFPFMMTSLFYFGLFYLLKDFSIWPELKLFIAGAGIAIFVTALVNYLTKISAHMVGIGGLLGVFIAISYFRRFDMMWLFVIIVLIAGIIGQARLTLNEHRPFQLYLGFFTGLIIQLGVFLLGQNVRFS